MPDQTDQTLAQELRRAYPELAAVEAAAGADVYVVGGAVRDLLLGRGRADNVDVVVEGDPGPVVEGLGADSREHERFATAKVDLGGLELDIAAARTETYAAPGALPDVRAGADIEADLGRRDFTINAIAVGLRDGAVLDPHGGRADLEAGLLRVLHPRSFEDDPTRALRGARYGARLGLEPEPETAALLRDADLATVSEDRRRAELLRIASEPEAVRGFELLADWGLVEPRTDGLESARRVDELLKEEHWAAFAPREASLLAAFLGPVGAAEELAGLSPERPADAVTAARPCSPVELLLARAAGATWLERYLAEWSRVGLEIDGADLIAAGVPEGPRVGAGLAAALELKLNGEIGGREEELAAALAAGGGS